MATEVEAAKLLVYQAAWLADRKDVRFTKESSMAKLLPASGGTRRKRMRADSRGIRIHQDYPRRNITGT